jgi:hypothetical protein
MMDDLDELIDTISDSLYDVGAGIRPPSSKDYTRHSPLGGLIEILCLSIVIPILNGLITGLLLKYLDGKQDSPTRDEFESLKSKLSSLSDDLRRNKIDEAALNSIIVKTAASLETVKRSELELQKIAVVSEVQEVLERFHIGPQTSHRKAEQIWDIVLGKLKQ